MDEGTRLLLLDKLETLGDIITYAYPAGGEMSRDELLRATFAECMALIDNGAELLAVEPDEGVVEDAYE